MIVFGVADQDVELPGRQQQPVQRLDLVEDGPAGRDLILRAVVRQRRRSVVGRVADRARQHLDAALPVVLRLQRLDELGRQQRFQRVPLRLRQRLRLRERVRFLAAVPQLHRLRLRRHAPGPAAVALVFGVDGDLPGGVAFLSQHVLEDGPRFLRDLQPRVAASVQRADDLADALPRQARNRRVRPLRLERIDHDVERSPLHFVDDLLLVGQRHRPVLVAGGVVVQRDQLIGRRMLGGCGVLDDLDVDDFALDRLDGVGAVGLLVSQAGERVGVAGGVLRRDDRVAQFGDVHARRVLDPQPRRLRFQFGPLHLRRRRHRWPPSCP